MRRPARTCLGVLALAGLVALAGCPAADGPDGTPTPTPVPSPTPTPTPIADPREALLPVEAPPSLLDGGGDHLALRKAVDQSLSWLRVQRQGRKFTFGERTVTTRELMRGLQSFRKMLADRPSPEVLQERVLAEFDVLEAAGATGDRDVLFTGYYEPMIEASLTKRPGYEVPIYRRPSDFVEIPIAEWGGPFEGQRSIVGRLDGRKVRPYWSREQIGEGSLAGRRLEIAWAKDPVDLFFVEIQGSGSLKLPNGKTRRIGYAGSNGRPYRSIGALLIGEQEIPPAAMSMQALREWLAEHPEERARVLDYNTSYVFFRFLSTGPVGSLNRPVTPERSIATDMSVFPPSALAFIRTEHPVSVTGTDGKATIEWKPLERFVLNQDTGGAIEGAGRVDVFWGQGPQATLAAGMMKQPGRLYFLVPKDPASGSVTAAEAP